MGRRIKKETAKVKKKKQRTAEMKESRGARTTSLQVDTVLVANVYVFTIYLAMVKHLVAPFLA